MTADSNYRGFPMPVEQDRPTIFPPKDETWMPAANCLGLDGDLFFPGRGDDQAEAKTVCRSCSVQAACLEYAMTPPLELWGIWGGLSERERRKIRRARWTA